MTQLAVECSQVSKRYGRNLALHDLSVSISSNGIVGVLGPNGSGKSTLFRLLTGLARPDSGHVEVLGQTPGWRANANIAYLPDRARWYPDHTGHQALSWANHLLPGFDLNDASRLAKWMGIDLSMKVGGMSRGQEARLMLTICLARQVPLMILDEPFAGIDVISRSRIIEGIIQHISERACTVLISTHEISEAESLFDDAIFLRDGQVILSGAADALRGRYGSMNETFQSLYR